MWRFSSLIGQLRSGHRSFRSSLFIWWRNTSHETFRVQAQRTSHRWLKGRWGNLNNKRKTNLIVPTRTAESRHRKALSDLWSWFLFSPPMLFFCLHMWLVWARPRDRPRQSGYCISFCPDKVQLQIETFGCLLWQPVYETIFKSQMNIH